MNRNLANNNNNNNGKYNMNFDEYLQCTEMSLDDNQRRILANNNYYRNGNYYGDEEVQYYIGPYCAEQGGEIRLGVFNDDTCTVFADDGAEMFELVHSCHLVLEVFHSRSGGRTCGEARGSGPCARR